MLRVALFALFALFAVGCGGSEAPPRAPVAAAKPDPCATLRPDPARGPGLFFPGEAMDGKGSFVSEVPLAVGATLGVVTDAWSVPEELPAVVDVVSSTPLPDGSFAIRFTYGSTPSEPTVLVGPLPVESVTGPLAGKIGDGLTPVAASIGVPQVTYQVTLPNKDQLFQKMVRCTEASYVEQIWVKNEVEADIPRLVSSSLKKIPPPGPKLGAEGADAPQKHIIYVHGAIVREQGPEAVSPEFGPYRFAQIVEELAKADAQVHAAVRAKDSSFQQGTQALVEQVKALLASGARPEDITIIGASEGGIMSLVASGTLANDQLSFVIMGSCSPWALKNLTRELRGRILSIYEQGDQLGSSCSPLARKSTHLTAYREIPLHTGLRHGFLYRPLPEWINPTLRWSQRLDVAPWGP